MLELGGALGLVENFSIFSGPAMRPRDALHPSGNGTWCDIKRAGGQAARSRAMVDRMLEFERATKSGWTVASASILRNAVRKMLSETFRMRKRTAPAAFFQSQGYHCLLSWWYGRIEEEIEERGHDVEVIRKKLLTRRGNENILDMSWWRLCKELSVLSGTGARVTFCEG